MGRPRSYDHQQVLKKAMMQFWQTGFAETSLSDLEAATALNRYSLYKGFGDKEALFEQALDYYQDNIIAHMLAPLTQAQPNLITLAGYFQQLNTLLKGKYGSYGCLFQNSQKEGISQNKLVGQYTKKLWIQQSQLFTACLQDESCQLPFAPAEKAVSHAVQLLLAQNQAQISLARSQAPAQLLDSQCEAVLALITSWSR